MERLQLWLEWVYKHRIKQQFDRIVPVVADEGYGKSTMMIELTGRWQRLRGMEPTTDSVLDRVVWDDRDEFKQALAESEPRSVIPVMDAARILYKRDAMVGEQKEVEKDLLDVRTKEFLILLGFQDWDDIPSMLQKRRAKNVLYIPRRGVVWGYSRNSLDERYGDDEWPEPDMVGTFPSLEGTEIWDEFKRVDKQKKEARMHANDDSDAQSEPDEMSLRDVAADIKSNGVSTVVSLNEGNKTPYIDPDLIELDYNLSIRKAKKVKKLLKRDPEVVISDDAATANAPGAHT